MMKLADMFEENQGETLYLYFSPSVGEVELHGYENIQRFYQHWQVGKPIPENWREVLAADTSSVRPKEEQPFLIESGSGTKGVNMIMVINPGEGPVEGTLLHLAELCIEALVEDMGLEAVTILRQPEADNGGRYGFRLKYQNREVQIRMPGWAVEDVRFLDLPEQDILAFPRLFVDGNGWVWKLAVSKTKRHLIGAEVE